MNKCKGCSKENTNVEILTRWQDPTIEELKTRLVTDTEKAIKDLQQKVEQLENIKKEAIEYIKSYKNDYAPYELSDYNVREILNILNKGGNKQ